MKKRKRWTLAEDVWLFEFYEATSAWHMSSDLGRSEKACRNRVIILKGSGAWAALKDRADAEQRYREALGIESP